ncbi:hypothetical protein HYZ41_01085 [archaeon]|nr:hypothetical protein [archaeon]
MKKFVEDFFERISPKDTPIIPKKGEYPGRVIATKEDAEHGVNAKIDITEPVAWVYRILGYDLEETKDGYVIKGKSGNVGTSKYKELKPPVSPANFGNTYVIGTDGASMHDYNSVMKKYKNLTFENLLRDVLKKYNISFESEKDMINKYGSIGFEYKNDKEDVIKMAYDIPVEKKIDVLAHEASAKELLGENRTDGDHDARHNEIIEYAEVIKETYLRKALEALRN